MKARMAAKNFIVGDSTGVQSQKAIPRNSYWVHYCTLYIRDNRLSRNVIVINPQCWLVFSIEHW